MNIHPHPAYPSDFLLHTRCASSPKSSVLQAILPIIIIFKEIHDRKGKKT